MTTYRITVESWGRDPSQLRALCERSLPRTVEASDDDQAGEEAEKLFGRWAKLLLSTYSGPHGTGPTGLDGLCVSAVKEAS